MLKPGIYHHSSDTIYANGKTWHNGDIWLEVKETEKNFIFVMRRDTTHGYSIINDAFTDRGRLVIRKDGSRHAMTFSRDDWFCLYPYRAGVPFAFRFCGVLPEETV